MPTLGRITKTNLANLEWMDSWRCDKPNLLGARFGLELAQLAYDFLTEPWIRAGWTDIAIQVDRRVLTGIHTPEEKHDWRQLVLNDFLPKLAKRLTVLSNPITQVRGLKDESLLYDTGKAITMIKPLPDGRFAVAIGFTGTGKRPQDWVSNMRFAHPNGLHTGFEYLAELYDSNADDIQFPTAAVALGLEQLTLADVLAECSRENSRFTLVMAGHSQGAAVLQLWAYRHLGRGLRAENLIGMGFACPMVASGLDPDDCACPLALFVSNDDLFTRTGLMEHLGHVWAFDMVDSVREICYAACWEDPFFRKLLGLMGEVNGIEDAMLIALGFLEALETVPRKEAGAALGFFVNSMMAERWLPLAEDAVAKILRFMRLTVRRYYRDLSGNSPPEEKAQESTLLVQRLLVEHKAPEIAEMFFRTLSITHALSGSELGREDLAPYSYMVVRGFDSIRPAKTAGVSS